MDEFAQAQQLMREQLGFPTVNTTTNTDTGATQQANTTQEQTQAAQEQPTQVETPPQAAQAPQQEVQQQQEVTASSVSSNDWLKNYVEATGHTVQTSDEIKEALAYRDKFSQLQNQYQDLEAKSKVSPYANDLVKTLNELYANGAKETEVKAFIDLQSIDTDIQTPNDYVSKGESLIKAQMKHEKPFLSNTAINALYEKKYGDFDKDDELSVAEFQSDAHSAKAYIDAKKVSAAQPDSIVQFRQTAEQAQQLENNIKAYVSTVKSIEAPFEFKIGNNAEKFVFKASAEHESMLQQVLANSLVSKGIAPTQENLPKINAAYSEAFWQVCGAAAVESAYRHAAAEKTKQVYAAVNGVEAPPPAPNAVPQPKSVLDEARAAWKKANNVP